MRHFSHQEIVSGAATGPAESTLAGPTRYAAHRGPSHTTILAACGAMLVIAIVAATIAIVIGMRSRALTDTERELRNVDSILAEQTAQSFRAVELIQDGVVQYMRSAGVETPDDVDRKMSSRDVHAMLANKISGLPHVDAIAITNAAGQFVNLSRSWPAPDINIAERDFYKELKYDRNRQFAISEPIQNRTTGTWSIFLLRKYTSANGEFLGLIHGSVRLDYFSEQFSAIALGEGGAIALFRDDGLLLARHPHHDWIGKQYGQVPNGIPDNRSMSIRLTSEIDGMDRLVALRRLAGFPGIVAVSLPAHSATAQAEQDGAVLVGSGGALALAVGALVFFLARRNTWERRRAAFELSRQASRLDAAISNMSQGLVMFDSDARILLCNDRYSEMYKLSRDQVRPGLDLITLIQSRRNAGTFFGDPVAYCRDVAIAIANGGTSELIDMPDGRSFYIITRPIDGGGWVATHEDVTERRRAELERDRNRDFLDRVVENVPAMIIVKDARDLRYVLLNKASETWLGFEPGGGIGRTARDVFNPELAGRLEATDRQVLQDRQVHLVPQHDIHIPGAGTRVHRTTKVPILGKDGEPAYLLVVAEDLTDRKAMEMQLQQAMKMEAVGNLTGGIAHDFNNLLMVMIGNLDLLVEELANNPTALEKLQLVLEASLNGAELTRQMLAFARRQPLKPKCIVLEQLVDATARLLKRTLGQDIDIELRLSPTLWPVRADESQLQSSLVNIAINSRDAMPGGGRLVIEADNFVVDSGMPGMAENLRPGDYAVISISDTGDGMPPELIARAFEPFFTTKPQGKGTGLGLSMVYGFAKQSNGHISIYSEVGRGTTLKLYLPRDVKNDVSPSPSNTAPAIPLGGGEVILAVDDNKDVLDTVARQLSDLGYNVATAGSAFSALRMLEDGLPASLLFSDVVMPGGLNGKELADEARRRNPGLKILLTSGFTGAFLADDAMMGNAYNLLSKPYRKDNLARAIRNALDSASPLN